MKDQLINAHGLHEKIQNDPYRPKYHFCVPFDLGFPADPNAPFYFNGKYHLMFIYESRLDSYRWGHAISNDLIHWHFMEDAIIPDDLASGIYSGGCYFSAEEKRVYCIYWALGKEKQLDAIRMVYADAPNFNQWIKYEEAIIVNKELGIAELMINGQTIEIGSADPSNIWKSNEYYYFQLGNLLLLNKYRNQNENKAVLGDHTYLCKSKDLHKWEYVHEFYQRNIDNIYTGEQDDAMCPFFGQLPYLKKARKKSNKYIQLFLSHNKGTQYYIGSYLPSQEKFEIESFGKMSFQDNCLFAPEGFINHDGRMITFYWLRDNLDDNLERELSKGWSGIHAIPRELYLRKDHTLGISPIREIFSQRLNRQEVVTIHNAAITNIDINSCEILLDLNGIKTGRHGICISQSENHKVELYLDFDHKELVFDLSNSDTLGRKIRDFVDFDFTKTRKNFLDIFIDNGVIEIFASDRCAISRQVFDLDINKRIISFINTSNKKTRASIFDMMTSNMF